MISDPVWLEDFYDQEKVGGPMIDLHVHDAHLIRMLFGMPKRVWSSGRMRGEVVEFCNSIFTFDDSKLSVAATCGVINQQGRPFTHGFDIQLENATLNFELAVLEDGVESLPLKVFTPDGKVERPEVAAGDEVAGFAAEIEEVISGIESGNGSEILAGDLARDAIILAEKQTQSVQSGEPVTV